MMNDSNIDVDRISILPIEIIHNIVGRLTMLDTARTSCLSKEWKSFSVSLPYLNIDHNALPRQWFKDFMARKVRSMSNQGEHLVVYKFKLCLDHLLVYEAREEIERCIKLVSETSKIEEFEFQITTDARYVEGDHDPYAIFHYIYNAKTLNVLRLGGLTLAQPSGNMKLSSLVSLSLEKVNVDRQSGIGWFFTSCPMIREIRLVDIDFLQHLKVFGLSRLKHLEISSCESLTGVEIQAPGLEKLLLSEIQRDRLTEFIFSLEIDSKTCETLKELTLCNSTIQGFAFNRMFSGCTNVKSLVLDSCVHFFKIKIWSQKLRKLVVRRCFDLVVTDISAPNLTSFSFCNFGWYYSLYRVPHIEKIIHQQEFMLDFSQMLRTKSILTSLWFEKFKNIQGQKVVIYPHRENHSIVIVLEDWSSITDDSLMTKFCEEAAKITITTLSFFDLADYVIESNHNAGNKLENVITISSTEESGFYEAMKKKKPTISCKRCSFVDKIAVDTFLSERCCRPLLSDESVNHESDIDGFLYQVISPTGVNGTFKAFQFSIRSL